MLWSAVAQRSVDVVERGSSAVECQTRKRERAWVRIPFVAVSKLGHFRPLQDITIWLQIVVEIYE